MIKKLAVVIFFLGAMVLISAPAFSQDDAVTTVAPEETPGPAAATEAKPADEPDALLDEEALPAEEGAGEGVITGEVISLDTTAGSISVKALDGAEKAFKVVDGETILWKGIEDIKLSDIKKGENAEVGYYTDDSGKLIASWVDVIVPEQPAAAGSQVSPGSEAVPATIDEE